MLPSRGAAGFSSLLVAVRTKLRVAIASVVVAWLLAFAFAEELAVLLARPLLDAWSRRADEEGLGAASLHFGSLVEPFWTFMSLSFWAAIVLSAPVLFFQLWRVLSPRLPPARRNLGVPFALGTGLCFAGGVVFCYLVVLPTAYEFLLSYADHNLAVMRAGLDLGGDAFALRPALFIEPYLSLTTRMLLAFGIVFELPVMLGVMAWLGVVSHRSLWRFNRWAVVLAFAVAALLTPGPDVVSQILMALPLITLYNLSILIAWLIARKRERAAGS